MQTAQSKEPLWKAKNVPNDELDLQVPIFDTGLVTCEASERILAVCTGSGELRTYDVRASNRPVTDT